MQEGMIFGGWIIRIMDKTDAMPAWLLLALLILFLIGLQIWRQNAFCPECRSPIIEAEEDGISKKVRWACTKCEWTDWYDVH